MVRGLTWQYGRHDKQVVGRASIVIERAKSKAKIEVISRVWSSCLQGSQSCRKLDPRKRTQQVPRSRTRLPALPKTRTQTNGTTINHVQCTSNMMQNMYDMQDMICDAYACSGRKMMNMAVTWQTKHATGKMR